MADKTKRVDGEDLTAACFLIVGDAEDTSTWKLPWKFSTDEKTKSHLRNAIARFGQLTGVSDADKEKAWTKLKRLCKQYGIDVSDEDSGKSARMERKRSEFRIEVKDLSEAGSFEGKLSVYGNVDEGSDCVEAGAFTKTIRENGNEIPLLWQHKSDEPIGKLALTDGTDALRVKGQLLMDLPEAQKAYKLIKAGIVKGLSIGFKTIKDSIEDGVRHLKEVRLFEGSIVTFPMNQMALITSVKSAGGDEPGDFNEELTEVRLYAAFWQMMAALQNSLQEIIRSDLETADKATLSATVIEQFAAEYASYLPAYLDLLAENEGRWYYMSRGKLETKEGRTISSATQKAMQSCHAKMMEGHSLIAEAGEMLKALWTQEAGDEATSDTGAAGSEDDKSEPVDHSAVQAINELKGLYESWK